MYTRLNEVFATDRSLRQKSLQEEAKTNFPPGHIVYLRAALFDEDNDTISSPQTNVAILRGSVIEHLNTFLPSSHTTPHQRYQPLVKIHFDIDDTDADIASNELCSSAKEVTTVLKDIGLFYGMYDKALQKHTDPYTYPMNY
jgi:hypothetical protein